MWVFVDTAELELMRKVLSITDMFHQPEECGPLEKMGGLVLGNINAIAEAAKPPSAREEADKMLKLMLPSLTPTFSYDDLDSLITHVAAKLKSMFDEGSHGLVDREDFEIAVVGAYGPQVSGRTFEKAWRKATNWRDENDKQPHKWRTIAGRKPAV